MRSARVVLAIAGTALLVLGGCGSKSAVPELMNLRSSTNGPDEFGILPPKPLELPLDLATLPEPTPGGTNLSDRDPMADALIALGGQPGDAAGPIPSGDAGLYSYLTALGGGADIRAVLAAEDLRFRQKNRGRPLERWFNTNVYFKAYEMMWLDQEAELARWRTAGAKTPSAPPSAQP